MEVVVLWFETGRVQDATLGCPLSAAVIDKWETRPDHQYQGRLIRIERSAPSSRLQADDE